jgi:hypothetical protein
LGEPNSATRWLFAQNGIEGPPWANLSRTGLDTRVEPNGLLRFGPHNLLLQSQDFTTASWVKGFVTTPFANVIQETAANAQHQLNQGVTVSPGVYTQIVRAQLVSGSRYLSVYPQGATVGYAIFDLENVSVVATGGGSLVSHGITLLPTGERRCWVTINQTGTTLFAVCYMTPDANPAPGYVGNPTVAIRLNAFRAIAGPVDAAENDLSTVTTTTARYLPIIEHDPVTLVRRGLRVQGSATTLVGPSEDLSSSAYTKELVTFTVNANTAPDGTNSADTMLESTDAAPQGHYFYASPTLTAGGSFGVKVFVKPLTTGRKLRFLLRDSASNTLCDCVINPENGDVYSVGAGAVAVTSYPTHGYYLIETLGTAIASGAGFMLIGPKDTTGLDYQGDGRAVCALWGLNVAPPGSYIPNSGTGSAVRARDGLGITGAAFSGAFPAGLGTNTIVLRFTAQAVGGATLLGISDNSSAGIGTASALALAHEGTALTLYARAAQISVFGLIQDGVTLNTAAVSWDNATGKQSICVNGGGVVETTNGILFSGVGSTSLSLGTLRASAALYDHPSLVVAGARVLPGQYITGAALQALSA